MKRSSEDIDATEKIFNREANVAKNIVALAKREQRELTAQEIKTFEAAVDAIGLLYTFAEGR